MENQVSRASRLSINESSQETARPFINVFGNPRDINPAIRKTVRSHVMHRYRKHRHEQRREKQVQFHPRTLLSGNSDPFNVLAVPSSKRVLLLLSHNTRNNIRTSVHADPSGNYRSYNIEDAAWLYMTISFAAAYIQRQRGQDDFESTRYLSLSLRSVHENLADPLKQASDSTIATVSCLANMENLNGLSENGRVHLYGLYRMVQLRGGVEYLGMRGILKRMVLWADLLGAIRARTVPGFPEVHFIDMQPLWRFSPPGSFSAYDLSHRSKLTATCIVHGHADFLEMLGRLHELSTFLNLNQPDHDDLPSEATYPDRVYSVEHFIITHIANSTKSNGDPIFEVLLHASLLFIYTNLRQTPVGGQMRRELLSRLREVLAQSNYRFLAETYPVELLWAYILGVHATEEYEDLLWFLSNIKEIFSRKGRLCALDDIWSFCRTMPLFEKSCMMRCSQRLMSGFNST